MTGPFDRRDRSVRLSRSGFSLVEALVGISVLGILAALALPYLGKMVDGISNTKAKKNAITVSGVSKSLSAAGVAHVLPTSLGGAEATTRLLRRGITVPDGAFAGSYFGIPSLAEDEVAPTSVYLDIVLDTTILRMVYDEEPNPVEEE